MMRVFELCRELRPDGSLAEIRYLVPNALPNEVPMLDVDLKDALRFELYFPRFMPSSVISRFMIHIEADPSTATLWRTGIRDVDDCDYVVATEFREQKIKSIDKPAFDKPAFDLIDDPTITIRESASEVFDAMMRRREIEQVDQRRLNVAVCGKPHERITVLEKIRHALTLATSFPMGLEVVERVPLPDNPKEAIEYEFLLKLAECGTRIHDFEGSDGEMYQIDVEDLLGRIGEGDLVRRIRQRFDETDFVGLCREVFPAVAKHFDTGMTYWQKMHLLLKSADVDGFRDRVEAMTADTTQTTVSNHDQPSVIPGPRLSRNGGCCLKEIGNAIVKAFRDRKDNRMARAVKEYIGDEAKRTRNTNRIADAVEKLLPPAQKGIFRKARQKHGSLKLDYDILGVALNNRDVLDAIANLVLTHVTSPARSLRLLTTGNIIA